MCVCVYVYVLVPSPTLSPTDAVPRGLQTMAACSAKHAARPGRVCMCVCIAVCEDVYVCLCVCTPEL